MTDKEYEAWRKAAEELGAEAGKNAADWWEQDAIGGRATRSERECAELTLRGLDDGDPLVLDSLPCPNLSGEWAGDPTPRSLAEELGFNPDGYNDGPEILSDLCDAWQDAASDAVVSAVESHCRSYLEALS